MNLKLHHVNLASDVTPAMDDFYQNVLGFAEEPELARMRIGSIVTSNIDTFVHDGSIQFHLSVRDSDLAFRAGHVVNPLAHGHLAFETNDIAEVKAELTKGGIPFSDYGVWAMGGWYQIFFHDPAGNVIEIFQAQDEAPEPSAG